MTDLSCDVIRDLIPGHADGLTSAESNRLVEEHVEICADCRAALSAMRAPESPPPADAAELDYLKKNRRKSRRAVLWAIAGAALVFLAVLSARVLLIGEKTAGDWLYCETRVEGNALLLSLQPKDSAGAVAGVQFSEEDGTITVTTRRVLASALHRGQAQAVYTAAEPIRRVVLNGYVLWDEGTRVSTFCVQLFDTRHRYVGDMVQNGALARVLFQGAWLNELETDSEPYGWRLLLSAEDGEHRLELSEAQLAQREPELRAGACVLLALVQNLDHVEYVYTQAGEEQNLTVTAGDAAAFFGRDIKDCYDSPRLLEQLLQKTNLRGPVYFSASTDH